MPCKYCPVWATRRPWNCCWRLSVRDTNKVLILTRHLCLLSVCVHACGTHYGCCACVCAGLLGAAPVMPLLTNPALSAALVQLLLQNQVQQVANHVRTSVHSYLFIYLLLYWLVLLRCVTSCCFCLVSWVLTLPFSLASLSRNPSSLGAGSALYRKPPATLCEWYRVSLWCGMLGRDRGNSYTARPDSCRRVTWRS